jgi:hypothetical protein
LLTALAPGGRLLPDFVLPTPAGLRGVLAGELDEVAATPPEHVRAELDLVYPQGSMPADRLDPLADVIGKTRAALVDAQRRGRMVLYQRTAAATALLAATRRDGSAERIG